MTSKDPRMRPVLALMSKAARCTANVLIEGESGVGKRYLAARIHEAAGGKPGGFCSVFCMPEVEEGGEGRRLVALLREARGDSRTMYIRGVDLLDTPSQRHLLTYLDSREEEGGLAGARAPRTRLIFSSQKDLLEESRAGRFLSQLYLRISVVRIRIPPLRQRETDIVSLAKYFVGFYSKREAKTITSLSREAEEILRRSSWDGNIHELKNVVNRAVVMANDGDSLGPRELGLIAKTTGG
jgi:DNA-binding NtrC family response regulator